MTTNATAILRQEHDAILKMLAVTEETCEMLDRGTPVPAVRLDEILEFFQVFADRCHHGKEEDLLFPLLEQKGIPRFGGPVGVMLNEHELGRAFVRDLAAITRAYATDSSAGPRWASAARGYAALLKAHIQKENTVLFVIAERLLSPAEQEQLARDFDRIESEKIGAGTHERLHQMLDRLASGLHGESSQAGR